MKMTPQRRALDKIYKRRDRYEIPEWQREEVWDTAKKQQLIDSILRGWRLPKFYFVKSAEDEYECCFALKTDPGFALKIDPSRLVSMA